MWGGGKGAGGYLLLQLVGQRLQDRQRLAARVQLALQLLEATAGGAELGTHVAGVAAHLLQRGLQVLEPLQLLLLLLLLRLQRAHVRVQCALLRAYRLEERRGLLAHRDALRRHGVVLREERHHLGGLLRRLEAQLARLGLDGRVGGRRHQLRHPLRQSVHVRAQPR